MKKGEFITSDTHWGHANIIKYTNRPFKNREEMDEEMIKRWNKKVPPGSIVYHLGDFSFSDERKTKQIIRRLNGTIRLVWGNHDKLIRKSKDLQYLFDWCKDYYECRMENGPKLVMFHFPIASWNGMHKDSFHLFGHSHGSFPDTGERRFDVGIDCHPNYEPFSYDEIMREVKKRKFKPIDHHE